MSVTRRTSQSSQTASTDPAASHERQFPRQYRSGVGGIVDHLRDLYGKKTSTADKERLRTEASDLRRFLKSGQKKKAIAMMESPANIYRGDSESEEGREGRLLNVPSPSGITAAGIAARQKDLEMLIKISEHGGDFNYYGGKKSAFNINLKVAAQAYVEAHRPKSEDNKIPQQSGSQPGNPSRPERPNPQAQDDDSITPVR